MRHTNIGRMLSLTLLALISVTILITSCTKAVRISNTDLSDPDPGAKRLYRITTTDNHVFEFRTYSISNDTLTMNNFSEPYSGNREIQNAEVSLPFDTIQSIERIQWDTKRSLLAVGLSAAAVTASAVLAILSWGGASD